MKKNIEKAANLIKQSKHITAFTGAGISVESGIPPFRGKDGLWSKYDPVVLDINYFFDRPKESWKVIKEIFYDFFGKAKANKAHTGLTYLQNKNNLKTIITQNIDGLHHEAGSKNILEFHGTSKQLVCTNCGKTFNSNKINLNVLPPKCNECDSLLKPDFVFFGEAIPEPTNSKSFREAEIADLFILVGTTGEIMPASLIPQQAKMNGAKIIEINVEESKYTNSITDIFLQGKATEIFEKLLSELE